MANSIKTWTPADYVNAAGRGSQGQPAPNAMDFMSRLNSNVKVRVHQSYCSSINLSLLPLQSIDFNCSDNSSSLVKIHKRERSSPTATSSSSSSQTSTKRYKLVSNDAIKLEPVSQESNLKWQSQSQSQPSTTLKAQQKEAPESRADFLREVCIRNLDQSRDIILQILHILSS